MTWLASAPLPPAPRAASYGDRAGEITRIAEARKLGRRIVRGYPILEAEVVYAGERGRPPDSGTPRGAAVL